MKKVATGKTPLHYASQEGKIEAVQTLLFNGAKNDVDDISRLPIHYAAKNNHLSIVLLLMQAEVPLKKICYAMQIGYANPSMLSLDQQRYRALESIIKIIPEDLGLYAQNYFENRQSYLRGKSLPDYRALGIALCLLDIPVLNKFLNEWRDFLLLRR